MKFITIVFTIFAIMLAQHTQQVWVNEAQYNFIGTASTFEDSTDYNVPKAVS